MGASLRLIEQQTYSYCCRPSKMFESQPAVPLPPPQVHVYRTVGNVKIEADVYFPSLDFQKSKCPIFLHIHGGGWMAGHRKEANLLVFYELLQRGFLVVSIDYRLLPEVSIEEQFDDIRAAEDWVRDDLPSKVKGTGWEVASEKVIVGGGSAGAHLAMMVPHLWKKQPLAILAFYGPTDFSTITPRKETVQMLKSLPPVTPEIAKAAIFDSVRTNVIEKPGDAFAAPRSLLPLELFRNGGIGEFVAARFTPDFEFRPPGSVPFEKIVNISPALPPGQLSTFDACYGYRGSGIRFRPGYIVCRESRGCRRCDRNSARDRRRAWFRCSRRCGR